LEPNLDNLLFPRPWFRNSTSLCKRPFAADTAPTRWKIDRRSLFFPRQCNSGPFNRRSSLPFLLLGLVSRPNKLSLDPTHFNDVTLRINSPYLISCIKHPYYFVCFVSLLSGLLGSDSEFLGLIQFRPSSIIHSDFLLLFH